jgi:hypothetical protein
MSKKNWWKVFKGDKEQKFFTGKDGCSGLARHPKFTKWRSVDSIVKESGLTAQEVEAIIQKYVKQGLVINNPKDAAQWGYWENVESLLEEDGALKSIAEEDKQRRIDKANPGSKSKKI